VYGLNFEFALLIGGALLLISGFFDIVDGQVAHVTKKTSKQGAFLDSVFDKIAEVAIFLGILISGLVDPYLIFLAITLSLCRTITSYCNSRYDWFYRIRSDYCNNYCRHHINSKNYCCCKTIK
jgi:archaetidylinositol phosphate synthase